MANSNRLRGMDQEFEDPINFMRRDTGNQGCQGYLTLGVTYDSMYPPNMGGVPPNYHSPRQTITVGLRCGIRPKSIDSVRMVS